MSRDQDQHKLFTYSSHPESESKLPIVKTRNSNAFTLIELLVVLAIMAVLISLLLPTIDRARGLARDIQCANNLRQVGVGLHGYLNDGAHWIFWRGTQRWIGAPHVGGMDWYVYGGRETGNHPTIQEGFFNAMVPRPLNPYIHDHVNTFRCPYDHARWGWSGHTTHFDYVGNSYLFNTYGWPWGPISGGLAGINMDHIEHPSTTVIFMDTSLNKSPQAWHRDDKGNVMFSDTHIEFRELPDPAVSSCRWNP